MGADALPTSRSRRRDRWSRGVLFAVGIDAIRLFTEVYLAGRLGRVDDLYGSIGFATVFMLWLYVVSRIVVATFGLNAARWRAEQRAPRHERPHHVRRLWRSHLDRRRNA